MSSILPGTREFLTPVYGTVFGQRAAVVQRLKQGDHLILVPDPPGIDEPNVWVHARGGDVVDQFAVRAGFSEPNREEVSLAVTEAVSNAIRHGSPAGAADHVSLSVEMEGKRLVITVRCAR